MTLTVYFWLATFSAAGLAVIAAISTGHPIGWNIQCWWENVRRTWKKRK